MTRTACLLAAFGVLLAHSARAETRTFIVANDGKSAAAYSCLRSSTRCERVIAELCREHGFRETASHRKLDRDEITGALPTSGPAAGHDLYAIACAR